MFLWIDDYSGILFFKDESGELMGIVIEIDWIIRDLNTRFKANLTWLEDAYEKALKQSKKEGSKTVVIPQVYDGMKDNVPTQISPLPNSKSKSVLFYTVGEEQYSNFKQGSNGYLSWEIGIIFWVNLEIIDKTALIEENFTQILIREVRDVLVNKTLGSGYQIEINNVERDVEDVYKEFQLPDFKSNVYLYAPYSGFRFNCTISMRDKGLDCI